MHIYLQGLQSLSALNMSTMDPLLVYTNNLERLRESIISIWEQPTKWFLSTCKASNSATCHISFSFYFIFNHKIFHLKEEKFLFRYCKWPIFDASENLFIFSVTPLSVRLLHLSWALMDETLSQNQTWKKLMVEMSSRPCLYKPSYLHLYAHNWSAQTLPHWCQSNSFSVS
jgi:hypothetical protein